jgi:hypothetical protein
MRPVSEAGKRFQMWNSFNIFREGSYEEDRYLQCEGTAIGSKLGKIYACCIMGEWEEKVEMASWEQLGKAPSRWWRFVDDIKGRWKGSKGNF